MSKETLKDQERQQAEEVAAKVFTVDTFFNENKKIIWGALAVILVAGLSVLCYHRFYSIPRSTEAQEQMFPAENSFKAENYELALNGDGNVLGFKQLIDTYGSHAGQAVYFYAGVCELQLGNYEEALGYLSKYKGKDEILKARSLGCIGDAYAGLGKYKEAVSAYEKAAGVIDNMFAATYLLKAGIVSEENGDSDKALAFYKKIKDQYPQSMEGYDVDKYISRIENTPAK